MSYEMKKGELVSGTKRVSGSEQKGVGRRVVMFSSALAKGSIMEK
jgi:hypothetical protein